MVFFACSLLPVSIVFVTFTWKQLPCWMSESTKPSQNHKDTHTLHRQTISTLTSTPIHTPTCWSKTPLLCGHKPKLWNTYTTRPFSRLTHCDKKYSLNLPEHVFGLKESHLHPGYELKAKRGTEYWLNMQHYDYSTQPDLLNSTLYLQHHQDFNTCIHNHVYSLLRHDKK